MPVIFLQWRAEVLQRVRRLISILSSQEGEHVEDQETALTWFFFSVELKCLQELADTPPDALQSDAMIGLLRLRRLCETWSVVRDEIKSASDFSETVNSFLSDQASPTGITRLKKIVNLLANGEPWDAGDSTCTQCIVERETPSWNKELRTLSYKGKHTTLRVDAETRSDVFNWFEAAGWQKVKIPDLDIVVDAGQVSNLVRRAKETAQRVGFVITRDGEELEWTDKLETERELQAELKRVATEVVAAATDRDHHREVVLDARGEVEELRKQNTPEAIEKRRPEMAMENARLEQVLRDHDHHKGRA